MKFNKIFIVMLMVCVLASTVSAFNCGDDLVVNHVVGNVAPVTKSVTYGTVLTDLTGENKCWITRNLGASQQASSATDATEASAGWYWQFNREQGYKYSTTRTPSTYWNDYISQDSDWTAANDPCTRELGAGWRLPTKIEWANADSNGAWDNRDDAYKSVLKIHAAGGLTSYSNPGELEYRGSRSKYWSSTQWSSDGGWGLGAASTGSAMNTFTKAYGVSVRCLSDVIAPPTYTSFTSEETTNFSNVTLSSVTSLTLAIDNKGKIAFPLGHSINSENQDYDTNVNIEDALIYVNSADLDSSFNNSAILTFEGVNC
ncbi:MAG: hypothetical protein KAI26_00830, partial [Nanoarchaeota archaeon]|nr:hypothetical protein [Nanoarchaeota archaeon]